jgi:hypothetical protein
MIHEFNLITSSKVNKLIFWVSKRQFAQGNKVIDSHTLDLLIKSNLAKTGVQKSVILDWHKK